MDADREGETTEEDMEEMTLVFAATTRDHCEAVEVTHTQNLFGIGVLQGARNPCKWTQANAAMDVTIYYYDGVYGRRWKLAGPRDAYSAPGAANTDDGTLPPHPP